MKVIYKNEMKRLPDHKLYERLVSSTSSVFNLDNMKRKDYQTLKFYYIDQDGDIISITCQGDLNEAYQVLNDSQIRFVCAKNNEEARQILGESAAKRSEFLYQSFNLV